MPTKEKTEEKSEVEFKPFVDSKELPEPTIKKTSKGDKIIKTGEARYFLRDNGLSYSLIAVTKKINSICKRNVCILKKKNPAHKMQYKKLIAQKIPILDS